MYSFVSEQLLYKQQFIGTLGMTCIIIILIIVIIVIINIWKLECVIFSSIFVGNLLYKKLYVHYEIIYELNGNIMPSLPCGLQM